MSQAKDPQLQWYEILKALRRAAGVKSQAGWGAHLGGVPKITVQRWERGTGVPDEEQREKIIDFCRERHLMHKFEGGPLEGLTITDDFLRELLQGVRVQETQRSGGRRARDHEVGSSQAEPDSLPTPPTPASRPIWQGLSARWQAISGAVRNRGRTVVVLGSISALAIILVPLITTLILRDSSGPSNNSTGGGGRSPSSVSIAFRSTGTAMALGDRVAITEAGDGLGVYSSPSTDAPQIDPGGIIPKGYEGEIIEGPRVSNGREWWKIKWVTKAMGWSAATSTNGTAWLQPLPGTGIFPVVSDVGLSYRIQVYEDVEPIGLAVRDGPGNDQPIQKARKHAGAQGWTYGSPKVIKGGDVVWWNVKWDDKTNGWSADSALSSPGGMYIVRQYAVGQEKVTLTLYVRERGIYDPVVAGAQVTALDAMGESFNLTANSEGLVTIIGVPGTWAFRISALGFDDACWTSDITSTKTQQAFFLEEATCP